MWTRVEIVEDIGIGFKKHFYNLPLACVNLVRIYFISVGHDCYENIVCAVHFKADDIRIEK